MRIVILGAGVIGATTAYYLARDGHEVTVVDRRDAAGLETSFANGGLVTPSMADPWAAPGVPAMLLQGLGRDDAPFVLRPGAVPAMIGWGLRFLRNCGEARWRENTEAVFKLATYSRDALDRLTEETGLAYDRLDSGTMRMYRSRTDFAHAQEGAEIYRVARRGVPCPRCRRRRGAGAVAEIGAGADRRRHPLPRRPQRRCP